MCLLLITLKKKIPLKSNWLGSPSEVGGGAATPDQKEPFELD